VIERQARTNGIYRCESASGKIAVHFRKREKGKSMRVLVLIVLSFVLGVGSAMADGAMQGLQTQQQFVAMKTQVIKDLNDHDKYKEITPEDQKTLMNALNRMDGRWQNADPSGQLTPAEQTAMANDQEVVTSILTHTAEDSRLVCERVATIGTNLPKRVCKSVAQRAREMKAAQDALRGGTVTGSD